MASFGDDKLGIRTRTADEKLTIHNFFNTFAAVPTYFSDVNGIFEDFPDRRSAPGTAVFGAVTARGEIGGNLRGSERLVKAVLQRKPVDVKREDRSDYLGFFGDYFKRKALFAVKLYLFVAVRSRRCDKFTLGCRRNASALQSTVNSFILSSGHKKSKLKILLIILVERIVNFERGNYFGGTVLKSA